MSFAIQVFGPVQRPSSGVGAHFALTFIPIGCCAQELQAFTHHRAPTGWSPAEGSRRSTLAVALNVAHRPSHQSQVLSIGHGRRTSRICERRSNVVPHCSPTKLKAQSDNISAPSAPPSPASLLTTRSALPANPPSPPRPSPSPHAAHTIAHPGPLRGASSSGKRLFRGTPPRLRGEFNSLFKLLTSPCRALCVMDRSCAFPPDALSRHTRCRSARIARSQRRRGRAARGASPRRIIPVSTRTSSARQSRRRSRATLHPRLISLFEWR